MHEKSSQASVQEKRRIALISVLASLFLTILKLAVALLTNSLALLSEAINSGLDIVASLVTFLAVRESDRPPDREHHYGHGKVENLSALIETLIILGMGVWILYEAIGRLIFRESPVEASVWAFVVMGISIAVDISRSRALTRAAQRHRSQALEADALHFRTDIWTGTLVIVGLALVRLADFFPSHSAWLVQADALAAIAVAGIVVILSMRLGRKSLDALLDRAPEGLEERIREAIAQVENVEDFGQLRLRAAGSVTFVEATVKVKPDIPAGLAHEVATGVEDAVASVCPECDMKVHIEPAEEWRQDIPAQVRVLAAGNGLAVHDVRVHRLEGGYQVDLDIEMPEDLSLEETHRLATAFERSVEVELREVARVETHIEVAPDIPGGQGREITGRRRDMVERIREIVEAQDGVNGCHDIRVRQVEGALYVSLHCTCPGTFSMEEAHRCSSQVEGRLHEGLTQVAHFLVHVEPR